MKSLKKFSLYSVPCNSNLIGIHVTKVKQGLKEWPLSSIVNKMWKMQLDDNLCRKPTTAYVRLETGPSSFGLLTQAFSLPEMHPNET